jgi:hypothetical protein
MAQRFTKSEVAMAKKTPLVEDTPPEETSPPTEGEETPKKGKPSPMIFIGLGIFVVSVGIFVGLCFLPRNVQGILRDVSIFLLVLLILISVLLLLALLAALIVAVNRISEGVDKLLERGGAAADQLKDTAKSVKGTVDFVGERVASPFIRISSWAAGIGEALVTFIRGKKQEGGSE